MFTPLSEVPTNSPILWITLANKGYGEYVLNFTQSMKRAGAEFKLIVFCIDDEIARMLEGNPHVVCVDARPYIPTNLSNEFSIWGQSQYIAITFGKVDVMRVALETGVPYVGYIDTDIVLVRDPTPTALRAFETDPAVQIVAQCGEGRYCTAPNKCPEFCTGVILFRNSPEMQAHLRYTQEDVHANPMGDQVFLSAVFKRANTPSLTIHKDIWIHGGPYGPISNLSMPKPADAELYHFNFLIGNEKKEKMKQMNMWYL